MMLRLIYILLFILSMNSSQIRKESEMSEMKIGDIHLRLDLVLGTGPSSDNIFKYPYSLAVDQAGRIYVSDRGNKRIQIFGPDGKFLNTIGGPRNLMVKLNYPKSIAVAPDERLYISDFSLNQSWLISIKKDLMFESKIKIPYGATQIGFFENNIVIATKNRLSDANIFIIDHKGRKISTLDSVGGDTLLAASRVNALIEASGHIYLADEFTPRVRKISLSGDDLLEFNCPILTKNFKTPQTGIIGNMRFDGIEKPLCYDVATDRMGHIYLLISSDYLENEKTALCQFDGVGRLLDAVEIPFLCSRLLIDEYANFYFISQMETGLLYRFRTSNGE